MRAIFLLLISLAITACAPPSSPRPSTEIEVHADGLAYLKGTAKLYAGSYLRRAHNGNVLEESTYLAGQLHGPVIRYNDANGTVRRRTDYDHGTRIRKRAWFPNGQIRADETWLGDNLHGSCSYWFEDGRLRKQATFTDGFKLHGQVLEYAEDGSLIFDVIMVNDRFQSGYHRPEYDSQVHRRFFSDSPNDTDKDEPKS